MATLVILESQNCKEREIKTVRFLTRIQAHMYWALYYFWFEAAYRKDVLYGHIYSKVL